MNHMGPGQMPKADLAARKCRMLEVWARCAERLMGDGTELREEHDAPAHKTLAAL